MVEGLTNFQRIITHTNFNSSKLGYSIHRDQKCLRLITTVALTALVGFVGGFLMSSFISSYIAFGLASGLIIILNTKSATEPNSLMGQQKVKQQANTHLSVESSKNTRAHVTNNNPQTAPIYDDTSDMLNQFMVFQKEITPIMHKIAFNTANKEEIEEGITKMETFQQTCPELSKGCEGTMAILKNGLEKKVLDDEKAFDSMDD